MSTVIPLIQVEEAGRLVPPCGPDHPPTDPNFDVGHIGGHPTVIEVAERLRPERRPCRKPRGGPGKLPA